MTDKEQEIAIAQACGWTSDTILVEHNEGYNWTEKVTRWWKPKDSLGASEESWPPHYTTDLNACHEMEKVLTITLPDMPYDESQRTRYLNKLEEMCGNKGMVMATAAQRTEAFLKTLGKWTD